MSTPSELESSNWYFVFTLFFTRVVNTSRMAHFVGLSGRQGLAPTYAKVHGSFEAVVADLAKRYELATEQLEQLSVAGTIELNIEFYYEQSLIVLECDCGRLDH